MSKYKIGWSDLKKESHLMENIFMTILFITAILLNGLQPII